MPLTISPQAAASVASAQVINQLNGVFAQISSLLENGIPARGNQPAISAQELKDALGPDNVARMVAVQTALSA